MIPKPSITIGNLDEHQLHASIEAIHLGSACPFPRSHIANLVVGIINDEQYKDDDGWYSNDGLALMYENVVTWLEELGLSDEFISEIAELIPSKEEEVDILLVRKFVDGKEYIFKVDPSFMSEYKERAKDLWISLNEYYVEFEMEYQLRRAWVRVECQKIVMEFFEHNKILELPEPDDPVYRELIDYLTSFNCIRFYSHQEVHTRIANIAENYMWFANPQGLSDFADEMYHQIVWWELWYEKYHSFYKHILHEMTNQCNKKGNPLLPPWDFHACIRQLSFIFLKVWDVKDFKKTSMRWSIQNVVWEYFPWLDPNEIGFYTIALQRSMYNYFTKNH